MWNFMAANGSSSRLHPSSSPPSSRVSPGDTPQRPPLIDREERSRALFAPGFAPSGLVIGCRPEVRRRGPLVL